MIAAHPVTAALALAALLPACAPAPRVAGPGPIPVIAERFVTAATPADEIDSVAAWRGPDGAIVLLATAKSGNRIVLYDAATGASAGAFGGSGTEPGRFLRPNGVFVADDHVFVVDRDNRRVQVFRAPEFEVVGTFGQDVLRFPYGLHVRRLGEGAYEVLVTDSFRNPDGSMPDPPELAGRIKRFRVDLAGDGLSAALTQSFGATSGSGALWTVESIYADPENDRILIAEEELSAGSGLRVYAMSGHFVGPSLDAGVYAYQAEGIALVDCGGGQGYWVASDQHDEDQRFHVFDRRDLRLLGSFAGAVARDTDGVWYEAAVPGFEHGALYAQHDDRAVVAFDWGEVAAALGLAPGCGR
ncbi:MAG TPA: phytase [Xanthomonadaceae bacterium]|nr:phytase [Xanthomonadaceae bacterium]